MKVSFYLSAGILCLVALVSSPALAQPAPVQPGPEHAMLKELEGTWDAVIKTEGPESKATMTSKMGVGGFWLISDFKGSFGEATFEGRGIDGFDLDKKQFVAVWIDSMSSAPMSFAGKYDEKSKTLTMYGEGKGHDGKPAKFKNTTSHPDRNHQVFKMYELDSDGKENLMMTIEYTRKK